MPVGQRAISQSVKDTQEDPGSTGQQKRNQVDAAGFGMHPAKQVEDYQQRMKYHKENIERFQGHTGWFKMISTEPE